MKRWGEVIRPGFVVMGLPLPVNPAAVAAMAPPVTLGDVQERLVRAWIVAEIRKRRGFQTDQRGLIFSGRTLVRNRRRQPRNALIRRPPPRPPPSCPTRPSPPHT